jgi:hypothetical protein
VTSDVQWRWRENNILSDLAQLTYQLTGSLFFLFFKLDYACRKKAVLPCSRVYKQLLLVFVCSVTQDGENVGTRSSISWRDTLMALCLFSEIEIVGPLLFSLEIQSGFSSSSFQEAVAYCYSMPTPKPFYNVFREKQHKTF